MVFFFLIPTTGVAIIAEADKGRKMVIIHKRDLEDKINTFIKGNNIIQLKTDPTQKFQRTTQNIIKQCKGIIKPEKKKICNTNEPASTKTKGEN
jgi:hypothetical protein